MKTHAETAKEIVERLFCKGCEEDCYESGKCCWLTIKDALEKQIPKKPINWLGKMPICPRCNRADYIKPLESYCKFCGQFVDWSEEE